MKNPIRQLVGLNIRWSEKFDQFFPECFRLDGNRDFIDSMVPRYLREGLTIYDIGGGKQPYLSVETKRRLKCKVVGIDISREELDAAPPGAYDATRVVDICVFTGSGDADLVICQSLLEHVPDTSAAIRAMASALAPGGILIAFVPCKNAIFARLSLLLPEGLKKKVLFAIYPSTMYTQGFRSYYDNCTPSKIEHAGVHAGLRCVEVKRYHRSSYLFFCFPLYLIWRAWTLMVAFAGAKNFCETFSIVMKK